MCSSTVFSVPGENTLVGGFATYTHCGRNIFLLELSEKSSQDYCCKIREPSPPFPIKKGKREREEKKEESLHV
jgi:hypothetical protein